MQINDGSGTEASTNGLGNLIVGYDADTTGSNYRSGSNNLIVGDRNSWRSYGGLVAGLDNDAYGTYASVTGGYDNVAGIPASVSGGYGNDASGAVRLGERWFSRPGLGR